MTTTMMDQSQVNGQGGFWSRLVIVVGAIFFSGWEGEDLDSDLRPAQQCIPALVRTEYNVGGGAPSYAGTGSGCRG